MAKYNKNTNQSLFCSDYLFTEALRKNSNKFLSKLNEIVDWRKYTEACIELYKGQGSLGAPMYLPELMFKMLFLSYLFNVSEREIERLANDSISMKAFLGLVIEQPAPDHSSLSVFKNRIINQERIDILENFFREIIQLAQVKGVKFGKIQVIDSTHTTANVNTFKDHKRTKSEDDHKPPRDPDAKTGVKGIVKTKDIQGNTVKIPKRIYGYKNHLSINSETNLITGIEVTNASAYDGHYLKDLLIQDLANGVTVIGQTGYTADKGYEDGENNAWLNKFKLKDGIFYKGMCKIKEAKVKFTTYTNQAEFTELVTNRYAAERVNGSLKTCGGLARCRYLGLAKMRFQTYLTAIVHNLKTLSRLLFGVYFRSPAKL